MTQWNLPPAHLWCSHGTGGRFGKEGAGLFGFRIFLSAFLRAFLSFEVSKVGHLLLYKVLIFGVLFLLVFSQATVKSRPK